MMEIKRDRYLKQLIESRQNGFIKVVTGIRRCGKSYLLNVLFYHYLLDNGVADDHIIRIDLEDRMNKELRNAKLKQFVTNIIKYNGKDNLDGDSFLQTAFCEWFSGKKENIAKNYSVLPKDSLVSKEGVEADLERLRKTYN